MIKRREILGVAALSAFLGAVVGLFLFGSMGGQITPGPSVHAQARDAQAPASRYTRLAGLSGADDPGTPLTTTTFSNVAEKVMPAVVIITSQKTVKPAGISQLPFGDDPFMRRFFDAPQNGAPQKESSLGSGVIVSRDGYILTNNHVVNGADRVTVRMDKHNSIDAQVVGTDPQSDLAVLKVDEKDLPVLPLGHSDNLKIGEWVMAVGSPFGLERSVSIGIVSAKGRSGLNVTSYEQFIQTDAAINHGNSGGALVNLQGELVGINTAIASSTGGSNGVGFAIPIDQARTIMESLIKNGKVSRGYIGVTLQDVDDKLAKAMDLAEARGAVVNTVSPGTPADKAGIKVGDVILKLNGDDVDDVPQLRNRIAAITPGTSVTLQVRRDETTKNFTLTLGELPKNLAQAGSGDDNDDGTPGDGPKEKSGTESKLGLEVRTLNDELAQQYRIKEERGVVITAVDADSRAADAGLREGDVILECNRHEVISVDQLRTALGDRGAKNPVLLRVSRGGNVSYVPID